jgi:ParB family chromosome partitioning protein
MVIYKEMIMSEVKSIKLSDIRENPVALRAVNRESEAFQGLVASMRSVGFFGAITVRPQIDPETQVAYYEIIDGLHRYSAAKDLGIEEINAEIRPLDQDRLLEMQIMANFHKVDTKPMDYARQLRRILGRNPMMTETDLANRLGSSVQFIQNRLGLNKINNPKIMELVDAGKIPLSNAFTLTKLPESEMDAWVERAMTQGFQEFGPAVTARAKELKEASRAGKDAGAPQFAPSSWLRKLSEIKEAIETPASVYSGDQPEGFAAALQWVLHLDAKSIEVQKAAFDQRQAETEAKKLKQAKERAEKKMEKAKLAQAEAEEAAAALEGEEAEVVED